ncbi:MAG: hypothetical protein KDE22_13300 [Rhodobacterales bacterium]|nr:hypothetical protein [Rhodobacterales bacterium]
MTTGVARLRIVRRLAPMAVAVLALAACGSPRKPPPPPTPPLDLSTFPTDAALADFLLAKRVVAREPLVGALQRMTDPAQIDRVLADPGLTKATGKYCTYVTAEPALFAMLMRGVGAFPCGLHAIKTIKDQNLLARYVVERPQGLVNSHAMGYINQPEALARIAAEHPNLARRHEAMGIREHQLKQARLKEVQGTSDNATLKQMFLASKDGQVRSAAIKGMTDQAMLRDLAMDKTLGKQSRIAVTRRMTDQPLLAQVAATANEHEVRRAALDGLTDPEWIFHVAREGATYYPSWDHAPASRGGIRAAAARRLTRPEHRRVVVTKEAHAAVRAAALENATDPALLARSATGGPTLWERIVATANLRDAALLRRLAAKQDNQGAIAELRGALVEAAGGGTPLRIGLRGAYVYRNYGVGGGKYVPINGEALTVSLVDGADQVLAKETFDPPFNRLGGFGRFGVVAKTPPLQAKVDRTRFVTPLAEALNRTLPGPRRDALAMSGSTVLLRAAAAASAPGQAAVQAAAQDPDVRVRRMAVERLTDQALLARLARTDPEPVIRSLAVTKLTDREVLRAIRDGNDPAPTVGLTAGKRLKDLELLQ